MQIVVLAPPRSGASLVTRIVNMMGASFDGGPATIGFVSEAPKGFWENSEMVAVNDRILAAQKWAWNRLSGWNAADRKSLDASLAQDVARIAGGLADNSVTKDPRLCLTWSHWAKEWKEPVVLLVHRSPIEVALSLKDRFGMPIALGLAVWEYYTVGQLEAARHAKNVIRVSHHEVVHEPEKAARRLLDAITAIKPNPFHLPDGKELTGFIEPSLHRSKAPEDADELLSRHQANLYAIVRGEKPLGEKTLAVSLPAKDAMEAAESHGQAEAKLRHSNSELAEHSQRRHELESELQALQVRSESDVARLEAAVERYRGHLVAIQQSRSWQLGSKLARLLRWRDEPRVVA